METKDVQTFLQKNNPRLYTRLQKTLSSANDLVKIDTFTISDLMNVAGSLRKPNIYFTLFEPPFPYDVQKTRMLGLLTFEAQIPALQIQTGSNKYNGIEHKVALRADIEKQVEFNFFDDEQGNFRNFIQTWANTVSTLNNSYMNYSDSYKGKIYVYSLNNSFQILRTFILKGVFPITIERSVFSFSNSDSYNTVMVQFSVDELEELCLNDGEA